MNTTATMNTTAPEAAVIDAYPNRDHPCSTVVTIRCPLCGSTHTHGLPDSSPGPDGTFGHRAAHCGTGGYTLTDPDRLVALSVAHDA